MNGCIPLDYIYHVSHTSSSMNIVIDCRIDADSPRTNSPAQVCTDMKT